MRLPRWLFVLLALGAAAPAPRPDGRVVVFVADGSGDSTALSEHLGAVARHEHAPLLIRRVPWCRGGAAWHDFNDTAGQLAAAARLAEGVERLRQECPGATIILAGHSSGTRVVVAAAELLPPASVDRIVLLGSSVSCRYDLRPALRASTGGIDSFFSTADRLLAMAEDRLGTADGLPGPTGGRAGFGYPCDPAACPEYAKLRQYGGRPTAGHLYWTRPVFLRRALLPMILTTAPAAAAVEP
jgi:pimeloyl-ACP methyl ester carboxylesterase